MNPTDELRRLVRCATCGRAVECTPPTLLRYTKDGWPRCCGQVMAFVTEPARPESPPGSPPPT